MADYNVNPGIDWGKVISMLQWERGVQADRRDQAEQAIRWQGEQDYKTLVDSGVDPMVALQRTASRIFHNQPREMSSAFEGAAERMRRKDLEGDPITKTLPDGTVFMRTLNGWTQVHIPVPRPEAKTIWETTQAAPGIPGVRIGYTVPEYKSKKREDAITSELDIYNKAAAPGWWTGNPSDPNQMTISSNRLAQAGVNAQTGKEFPPSFKGASGGFAPPATPDMIARFAGSPTAAAATNAPPTMPSVTPAQAQAEIARRFPTPTLTETVVVIGPNGRRGRIPKSELADALKQGYKLSR
jgi:hypothetical protein